MTADNSNDTTAQAENQGNTGKTRGRKPGGKRSATTRTTAAKRGRSSAKRSGSQAEQSTTGRGRSGTSRSRSASGRSSSSSSRGFGARLLASAGRAIPLASRGLGDQRMVQRLVDERPYMLGAIGLGIGAMIGLMLPGTLSSMTGRSSRGRR